MAASDLRFLGVARFVLDGDIGQYRQLLAESVSLTCSLFDRSLKGEPIDESYLTILEYQSVLDALAAQRIDLAGRLASHLRGREKLDRKFCHIFDRTFGYAPLAALADSPDAIDLSAAFVSYCATKGKSYMGYAACLHGIANRDSDSVNEGVKGILKVHKRLSSNGIFNLKEDEVLCVWGIALCNLAP